MAESVATKIQWENFSSFKKLQRIMVSVMRILPEHSHFRNPDRGIGDYSEHSLAESKLLAQRQSRSIEMKNLLNARHLHPKSRKRAYSYFISTSSLMRFTGCVKRLSEITYDVKHPIILDGQQRPVHSLLQHLYELPYHPGVDFMRSQAQHHYAVIKLRNTLSKIESSSLVCRRRKIETLSHLMQTFRKSHFVSKITFHNDKCEIFSPVFGNSTTIERKAMGFYVHVLDNPSRTSRRRSFSRH